MVEAALHPRFAARRLIEALQDSPVVLVHGPRQCGKSTLARTVGTPLGYNYISFDDATFLKAARSDPAGFLADLGEKTILDEVQRVPDLFLALKMEVDRDRRHGRYLLTGSANVLLVPKLADSLAGRMAILRLHPLSQCELAGSDSHFLDRLFNASFPARSLPRLGPEMAERIVSGGFPAALARPESRRRSAWYRDFVETIIQRDVRDLARIGSMEAMPRLLEFAAGQTSRLLNISDLSAPFQMGRATIRDYMTLLEGVFLLDELQPWHSNRLSRLIKAPKLHLGDSGLACSMLRLDAEKLWKDRPLLGQLLETFIYQELHRQADWGDSPTRFFHFRDRDGAEVDVVAERGPLELTGLEIKAAATVTPADFKGLRKLREAAGARFKAGVVLYDGEACAGFGEGMYAVPIRMLWEARPPA